MGKIKGWRKIGKLQWENLDAKQRLFLNWTYKTSSHNLYQVTLYKVGLKQILLHFAKEEKAKAFAISYMRSHPNG